MATLKKGIFRKNRVGCHQWVLKFKIWLTIARRTFNRFWIALYQILSWIMRIQKILKQIL